MLTILYALLPRIIIPVFLVLLSVLVSITAYYAGHKSGKTQETRKWETRVAYVQAEAEETRKRLEEQTRKVSDEYKRRLMEQRRTSGTPSSATVVRVSDPCAGEAAPAEAAPGVTGGTPPVAGEVTQGEWESENRRRFEENRLKLEALQEWVRTLPQ